MLFNINWDRISVLAAEIRDLKEHDDLSDETLTEIEQLAIKK